MWRRARGVSFIRRRRYGVPGAQPGWSGRDRRGQRPGMTSQEPAEIGRPRGEVREPRRANEILKAAAFFAAGLNRHGQPRGTHPPAQRCVRGRLAAGYQLYGAEKTWRLPGVGPMATEPSGTMRLTVYQAVPDNQKNEGSASSGQPPRITTAEPGRVRGEGAADAVMRRSGEKVATRLRLPRFAAARHEAIETLMSGLGVSAGRTFPAGMGS
jgi:hypothetical protein